MADRKPIRWAVPLGGESYMGIAAYYLTHEENMRKSFSQPSRNVRRTLPDGTTIDYIMNDVVDCIRISPPQRMQRAVGKAMTWDKLPPFEEGTENIDLSQMTEDPDVSGGYYCTVSVINGTDENGKTLPAKFTIKVGEYDEGAERLGWSIEQGIRQDDGTYKEDGRNATLLISASVGGSCTIVAKDGVTRLEKQVNALKGYFVKCHSTEDGQEYYGHLNNIGAIDYLCGYSPRMKRYSEVSLGSEIEYSGSTDTVPTVENWDTGWYYFTWWTGPIWVYLRGIKNINYTTANLSFTYSFKGASILTSGQACKNGINKETWYAEAYYSVSPMPGGTPVYGSSEWNAGFYKAGSPPLSIGVVFAPDNVDETYADGEPVSPIISKCWTYEDLYYLSLELPYNDEVYSSILSSWGDKPMASSQLSLREDNRELLFINPNTHDIAFRTMPGGEELHIRNVAAIQMVGDVEVAINEYDCSQFYFVESTEVT